MLPGVEVNLSYPKPKIYEHRGDDGEHKQLTEDDEDDGEHDESHELDGLASPLVDQQEAGVVSGNETGSR